MTGLVIADRVKETTATTGTGTLNLAGAVTQFQSFISGVGTSNQCNYCLLSGNGTDWETGIGTVTSGSPNTLSRTTVLASSNSGSLISLTGTSTVFLTDSASALRAPPNVAPPLASNWTQRNFAGTTSLVDSPIGPYLQETANQNSVVQRGMTLSSPSTPYTIDAALAFYAPSEGNVQVEVGWTDGTKIQAVGIFMANSSPFPKKLVVDHYSNFTTFTANDYGAVFFDWISIRSFFRIADNGTTVTFSNSSDGVNFVSLFSVAKSSGYLGSSGYTNVGLFLDNNTGGIGTQPAAAAITLLSWYQH